MTETEIPPDLALALAARYQLMRLLGRGGMATVFLARDLRHPREVAVKVFRPEIAATVGSDRFLREIEIAARLQHPHILTLIDSGESAGFLFYVMPFVEGESLRGLITRSGTLPLSDVLRLTRQVADALTYAHRRGVLHRDIKPENILLSAGHAMVADFGIARAVGNTSQQPLTRTGFPVGTPGYMSPEQAAGVSDLDARTDVFSLAATVYEMLLGELPGRWLSEEAVRLRRFLDAPAGHRARLDRLSAAVEQALVCALAINPEHRFATPLELAGALEGRAAEPRRFSDAEVHTLMRRGAEIEAQAQTDPGMTLGSVQRVAAEAGIDPRHVAAAARGLAQPEAAASPPLPPKGFHPLGAPYKLELERFVPGEPEQVDFGILQQEIALTLANRGLASQLGRRLSWRTQSAVGYTRDVRVTITPESNGTRLRVEERNEDIAGGYFGGFGGGLGTALAFAGGAIMTNVLHSPILTVVAVLGGLTIGGLVARLGFGYHARQRRTELTGLLDRLAAQLADPGLLLEERSRQLHRPVLSPPDPASA